MKPTKLIVAIAATMLALQAHADVVTDWNQRTNEFIGEARIGTPPAVRISAIVQTAALRALTSLPRGASVDAAVAAAHRTALVKLMPAQRASIEAAYGAALAGIAEGPAKAGGIALGEKAAQDVLAARTDDGAASPESHRPHAAAGAYVPTATPAVPQWAQRKPWLMSSPAQFRPAAPPALASAQWASEFEETKRLGHRASTLRTPEQTEAARFWDYSLPAIYHGVLRSVALQPGRDVVRNARLFAVAAQAMDDAVISVFDAKYHYGFWRPITAIRNADADGNDATARDAAWVSLIDAPMHPEYPSAHSILAASVATVIKAEVGDAAMPTLATSSPTAKNATRQWSGVDQFVQEVSNARLWGGIHFRSALRTGEAMGERIGRLAARQLREESASPITAP
ncbi:MAG: vanadium-dependent haloperoxidase [Rubrivivax sp.]|nr:vanadium-dependent haloperoxidase [Rubrivivax sp.]